MIINMEVKKVKKIKRIGPELIGGKKQLKEKIRAEMIEKGLRPALEMVLKTDPEEMALRIEMEGPYCKEMEGGAGGDIEFRMLGDPVQVKNKTKEVPAPVRDLNKVRSQLQRWTGSRESDIEMLKDIALDRDYDTRKAQSLAWRNNRGTVNTVYNRLEEVGLMKSNSVRNICEQMIDKIYSDMKQESMSKDAER